MPAVMPGEVVSGYPGNDARQAYGGKHWTLFRDNRKLVRHSWNTSMSRA